VRHSKCFVSNGVGHPLLLLCDAEAPHCRKNKACKEGGHAPEWPKVADTVIKAACSLLRPSPASPRGASRGVRRSRCRGGSSGVPHGRAGPWVRAAARTHARRRNLPRAAPGRSPRSYQRPSAPRDRCGSGRFLPRPPRATRSGAAGAGARCPYWSMSLWHVSHNGFTVDSRKKRVSTLAVGCTV
jgi:hypothetical protein